MPKIKKSDLPTCPFCKTTMVPKMATGWDTFTYWECQCETWPEGLNWEYGITIH